MAVKRMFNRGITESARFIKMPHEAQNLYFHLAMNADDDGVVEAYSIIRLLGVTEDCVKILQLKGFINILNEDLVAHITDWTSHNNIRSDRKIDSVYKNLLLEIVPQAKIITPQPRSDTGQFTKKRIEQSDHPLGL